jgi:hypothetical protein
MGFSTDGNGVTNRPVEISVGVARGACDPYLTQAETSKVPRVMIPASITPLFLWVIASPRDKFYNSMVAYTV